MIHFASLINPLFDADLFEHWIDHYLYFNFDTYNVWFHDEGKDKKALSHAVELFSDRGFDTHIITGDFHIGSLRVKALDPFRKSLPPDDTLVVADSDEFQWADDYDSLIRSYDVVCGELIDRYACNNSGPALTDAISSIPLPAQYPCEGKVEELLLKTLPKEVVNLWPVMHRRKIMACPARLPVDFLGSHLISGEKKFSDLSYSPVQKVFHYSWRKSLLQRMCSKDYYTPIHIFYMLNFFGIAYQDEDQIPDILREKMHNQEKMQRSKGWI